ncbi:hypothetical protein E2C01_060509 [Portunus trituberculatus]|uniref:Uncharacterized protein n=1 Tax=Portunus trituberculatus TaxID=210409 RepID=A0A5B7H5N2_PORTR|nr:hypothetical protein [Portunus trituberculatus]
MEEQKRFFVTTPGNHCDSGGGQVGGFFIIGASSRDHYDHSHAAPPPTRPRDPPPAVPLGKNAHKVPRRRWEPPTCRQSDSAGPYCARWEERHAASLCAAGVSAVRLVWLGETDEAPACGRSGDGGDYGGDPCLTEAR